MLIILEGCDATGKTTLANMLAPLLNAQIVHCTTETPNTVAFFEGIIYAAEHQNIICDRFCYGQFVYQDEDDRPLAYHKIYPINGPERRVDSSWDALRELEMSMLCHDVKVIYCYADAGMIANRMIARGEDPDPIAIDEILCGYKELWKRTLIQPIYFRT